MEIIRGELARSVHVIVHEAAIVDLKTSMEQPGLVNDVNVDRTVNLLDAARRFRVLRRSALNAASLTGTKVLGWGFNPWISSQP